MESRFAHSVSPFPGWIRKIYPLARPFTPDDLLAFTHGMEIYTRETPSGLIHIIHKYGLVEINCIIGEQEIEIWYDPEKRSYTEEYLDALISTRF